MTKTQSTDPKPAAPAIAAGLAAAMIPWSVGGRMATAWMEGATRLNAEWARFVAERLSKDAQTQHRILTCGSPIEAQRLGAEFVHGAVNDYLSEAARLSKMGVRVAQEAGGDA